MISRFLFIRSARHIQQALAPGLNTGPTRGKMPEGWTSTHGAPSDKCCWFNSCQSRFEIIVHQRDRQIGGALDDANAQLAQGGPEFGCPLHVDRLNAHTTFLEISLRNLRRQAEARPIGGCDAIRTARMSEGHSGGRAAALGPRGFCRTENPSRARERAPESSFRPSLSRRRAHNRARREAKTSGPPNRGTRHRGAAHRQ